MSDKITREQVLEKQIEILLKREQYLLKQMQRYKEKPSERDLLSIKREDLVKGIIMREILGPPKALEK